MAVSTLAAGNQAAPALSLSDIIDASLRLVSQTLGVRLSMLTRVEGARATIVAAIDRTGVVEPGAVFPFGDTFCMHMLRTGENFVSDTETAAPVLRRLSATVDWGLRAYIGVPVCLDNGQIFGALVAGHAEPHQWAPTDLTTLGVLARLLGHELSEDMEERATERADQLGTPTRSTDQLTGLIARGAFETHLRAEERRLRRYGGLYSVAVLEVEDLMEVNQAAGEAVGNQLIQGLGNTLMLNSRLVDCCARLKGGQFAVLFPETPANKLPAWQRRIEAAVQTWNLLHPSLGAELRFAVGIADSQDTPDYQAILAMATERMLSARTELVS